MYTNNDNYLNIIHQWTNYWLYQFSKFTPKLLPRLSPPWECRHRLPQQHGWHRDPPAAVNPPSASPRHRHTWSRLKCEDFQTKKNPVGSEVRSDCTTMLKDPNSRQEWLQEGYNWSSFFLEYGMANGSSFWNLQSFSNPYQGSAVLQSRLSPCHKGQEVKYTKHRLVWPPPAQLFVAKWLA